MDWLQAIEPWTDPRNCYAFSKGRVALYAILNTIGIEPGDEVLVPGFTCVAVPAAVLYLGAIPVFFDIDPETYNGDLDLALRLFSSKTRAIIIQHTFGSPSQLDSSLQEFRSRKVAIIEDCAHALGAHLNGKPVGTFGDASFCSLQWSKPATTGLGGIALMRNERLKSRMDEIYNDKFKEPRVFKSLFLATLSWCYRKFFHHNLFWIAQDSYRFAVKHNLIPGSSSEEELQKAAMPDNYLEKFGKARYSSLSSALDHLPRNLDHRETLAAFYINILSDKKVKLQKLLPGARSTYLRFPLEVTNKTSLLHAARHARIEIGDWFNSPLHPKIHRLGDFGYQIGICPKAEEVARRIINLPTHVGVNMSSARRIVEFILSNSEIMKA